MIRTVDHTMSQGKRRLFSYPAPLVLGRLIKREKRFLATVMLEDNTTVIAHCPNPGRMTGLANVDTHVRLLYLGSPNATRKLSWRWVQAFDPHYEVWVGVDTNLANTLARSVFGDNVNNPLVSSPVHSSQVTSSVDNAEAVADVLLPSPWCGYVLVRSEVSYGAGVRFDLLLKHRNTDQDTLLVEVKSVTLRRDNSAGRAATIEFPDAVTVRGAKHCDVLSQVAQKALSHRNKVVTNKLDTPSHNTDDPLHSPHAGLLFVAQRADALHVSIADDIDPVYANSYAHARACGVRCLAISCGYDTYGVWLDQVIPHL